MTNIYKLKLKNPKSVSFKVQDFCVPVKKGRVPKHTISGSLCIGLTAKPNAITGGYGMKPLDSVTKQGSGQGELMQFPSFEGKVIKRFFNVAMKPQNYITNGVIIVLQDELKFVPLQSDMPVMSISYYRDYYCFANGFSEDKDYLFAGCSEGLFAADLSLNFKKVELDCVPLMIKVAANRLFVLNCDGETIHFSSELDMKDFSGELSGSMRSSGGLGKIIDFDVFNGELLIVHEYGLEVLESDYEPSGFRLKTLINCYEEIISGSAKSLGSSVFFLTANGVCRYSNGKIELLNINYPASGWLDGEVVSFIYDGKYYLSFGNKTLVIERFFESWSVIENFAVRQFGKIWNEYGSRFAVLTGDGGHLYQIEPGKSGGTWVSDWFALSYASGVQYVKQVLVKTAAPVNLILQNNNQIQKIAVRGNPNVQKINVNFKGEMFRVTIETLGNETSVSALTAVIGFGNVY